jgi:hypothetical protein
VLRFPVGDSTVTSDQLHHLLPNVGANLELRVVPAAVDAHARGVTLLELAEFTPVVYLESQLSAVFLERPNQIAAYQRILAALADIALGHENRKADYRPGDLAVRRPGGPG